MLDLVCMRPGVGGKTASTVQQLGAPLHSGLLPPDATSAERSALATRSRERAAQLLGIHAARSFPAPAATGSAAERGGTVQRTLRVSRKEELHALCCELLIANKSYLQKVWAWANSISKTISCTFFALAWLGGGMHSL